MECKVSAAKAYFCKIHPDAIIPTFATDRSAGCDLHVLEDISIDPGEVKLVRTGIVAKPPLGYYWELCLRSSTPIKNPGVVLANGVGIIDPDYSGPTDEIKIPILNTNSCHLGSDNFVYSGDTIRFEKGQRIAQLVLRPLLQLEIIEIKVEELSKNVRGGFGASGF